MVSMLRSSVDLGRLAAAARRPGIDPRVWITRAVVTDVAFDKDHGLFADVQFQPDGDIETAVVGTDYAGDDFGEYWPIAVDDLVLVAMPMGDPGEGPTIIRKLFSGSERPPIQFSENDAGGEEPTTDPTLRLKDGVTMRIVGKNGANYRIELDGNATYEIVGTSGTTVKIDGDAGVRLGSPVLPNIFLGVARDTDTITAAGTPGAIPDPPPTLLLMLQWASIVTGFINGLAPGTLVPLDPKIGTISTASTKVKSE